MSAIVESTSALAMPPLLALLADSDLSRTLAWNQGRRVPAGAFLADVIALAKRLPAATHVANLCEDRYQFLRAFCAIAVAGKTNLLPPSRAPQAVDEVMHAYPASYALSDKVLNPAPARWFHLDTIADTVCNTATTMPMIASNHVVAIGFTSGSTGAPKPNPKTWGSVCISSELNATALDAQDAPNIVATVPPQHMYGLELSVLLPLRSRAAIHTGHPFFPADVARTLDELPAPRMLVTTPIHLRALQQDDLKLPELVAIVTATAPLDAELAAGAEAAFSTSVIELFGSTETCVIAQRRTSRKEAWQLYPGIGLASQPDGTLVSAPHFATPVLLQDIVELLPSRQFILRGRNTDLLEIGGKRASLADLNQRLLAIPGVHDGIVFQLDADTNGVRRLGALVVSTQLSEAQISTKLRDAIDPVFLPRPIRRVAALPRNGTGKLPREALLAALKAPLGKTN